MIICPLCSSTKIKKYWQHKDMILNICNQCSVIFQDKNSPAIINRNLINEIYNAYKKSVESHIKVNISRKRKIEKTLNIELKNLKILEIGCGNGGFALTVAKDNIYTAFEPYEIFQKELSKNNIPGRFFYSEFDKEKIKGEKFDLIVANDVIEHMENPKEILKNLKEHLNEKGFLWIEVPDESFIKLKGLIRIMTGMYIKGYPTNPDHTLLFNKKTFLNFLKNTDYKIKNYIIDSVWGDEDKLSVVFSGKIPLIFKIASSLLKFTSIDKIIGANLIGVLSK